MTKYYNRIDDLEAKKRYLEEKLEFENEMAKMSLEASIYKAKYAKSAKTLEKQPKNTEKYHERRHISKMRQHSKNYGTYQSREPTRASDDGFVPSRKAILDYTNKVAAMDPNVAFRIHKQGSMDRLKDKSMVDWHERAAIIGVNTGRYDSSVDR